MRTERNEEVSETLGSRQEAASGQALLFIIWGFVGTTAALTFIAFEIASSLSRRQSPLSLPSPFLIGLFYFLALATLLACILWTRFRSQNSSLPYKDFQQRTMIGLALANVSEYLALIWVILGGAFVDSLPLFAGSAGVTLLFILPTVRRRQAATKSRSGFRS